MWGPGFLLKGRWAIEEQIAHGAYSTVWRASNKDTGEKVAVKNLRVSSQLESAKRALREIEMLKHFIGSENILQIIDVVVIPGIRTQVEEICIVSELMEYDLHSCINPDEPLSSGHIKTLMYQILCGVQIMHAAHTLHRDLKPKNILVNGDLTTKICDLGMGRGKVENGSMLKMTMISRVATPSYRAPDGILNLGPLPQGTVTESVSASEYVNYSAAVDIWACGCIMAEMITCAPLFPHNDNTSLLTAYVDVLGCPSQEMLERIPKSNLLNQFREIVQQRQSNGPRLPQLFPQEDSDQALDLCIKLLKIDPKERISIDEALKHPYFDEFEPPPAPNIPRFFDPTENPLLDLETCNQLIIECANSFSPN